MKPICASPRLGVLLLALLGVSAHGQVPTIEDIAGAIPATDRPATEVPMVASKIVMAPDGRVYMADFGRTAVTRFDPVNGTLTTLPNLPSQPGSLAFDAQGRLYVTHNAILYRYDLATNQYTLPGSGNLGQSIADIALDGAGNVYVVDSQARRVRVVRPSGQVEFFAGSGSTGFTGDGGPALLASLNWPSAIAVDSAGNVYISDTNNGRIRRVSASTGIITTIAGTGNAAYNGEGLPALQSNIAAPGALFIRADGSLLFSDRGLNRVRLISGGVVTTIAGNGVYAFSGDGSPATSASLKSAEGIALDTAGNLYISDIGSRRLRRVAASTGIISTIAGNGSYDLCGDGGPASLACLDAPNSLVFDGAGNLAFADMYNGRVRRIAGGDGVISTVAGIDQDTPYAGDGGLGPDISLGGQLWAIGQDPGGNIYAIVNYSPRRIYRIDAQTNVVTAFAGTGAFGFSGDGGPATAATFQTPVGIAFDAAGNGYISDNQTNRIRKVAAGTGIITTFAGTGSTSGAIGDGGPATAASLNGLSVMLFDAQGNLVVDDQYHCRIRKIDKLTGIISTIAGNGNCTASGNGVPAVGAAIGQPVSMAYSPAGELYFATYFTIRRISTAGIVTTVVGDGLPLNNPSNRSVQYPYGMAFDAVGRLYITGASPDSIRRISGLPAPPPPTDSTPPIIVPGWTGTPGKSDWYRSNIQLQWSVIDNESTVTSSSGCTPRSVTQDTAGVTFTCTATSAGGTLTRSVTFKRDTVAPTLAFGTPTPAPDANGWSSGDVSIPFTTSDALSGVDSTSTGTPLTISGQGSGLSAQVVVTDLAGNSATFTTPAVKIDRTAPDVVSAISGIEGNAGWYRSDVQLSWTVTEPESVVSSTGCEASSVTTDTLGVTFTCTATSAGGITTRSVTIKRDATSPTLTFGTVSPLPDANGWRAAPVSVPFEASDATSGVASTSTPNPLVITQAGGAITKQIVVTDLAGNSATFTTEPFKVDASPPTITQFTYGTAGTNGWYRTDARVSFSVSDAESDILTREGCDEVLVDSDTSGATFTCTVTSAGGTASKSITIKRDATPPALTWGAASPAPNSAGWNTTDVSFAFTTEDATSGIGGVSHPSPAVVPFDGPGVRTQITVWDNAGNETTLSTPPVNIDRFAPVINYFVDGTPGNNGWYTSDVQVTWQVGKAPENILSKVGCENATITTDTAGTTFGCIVASGAGTTSSSVTIKRDATPPVLSFGTPSPAPNSNGWNKTNVSIPFTRSDALSGLASTSTASPLVLATEGANVSGAVVVADLAGNSATFSSVARNIDKTAPVAEMNTPEDSATYGFYQDVVADFWCTDTLLVSCTAPTANGALINTRTAGTLSYKITAKDSVYTTTHTHTYNVESTLNFDGFLPPASAAPTLNLVTRGALVPIRWRLPDGRGGFVTNPASFSSATVGSLTCGSGASVPFADTALGAAGISFDTATSSFVYNWQTSTSWTGCRKLTIKLKDNSLHELRFKFQ
jgi:sugar lactone lactonase YvrE